MNIAIASVTVEPLSENFAARITGVDFSDLNDEIIREIVNLMDRYGVLVFAVTTPISDEAQLQFMRRLGPVLGDNNDPTASLQAIPGLTDVGNIGPDNEILPYDSRRTAFNRGNELWHTDSSFSDDRGVYSLLKAVEIPQNDPTPTELADMRAAYDALPLEMQLRLDGLSAEHSVWHSRYVAGYGAPTEEELERRPPALQPLVNVNPRTGRKSIYLAKHICKVIGMSEKEQDEFLEELFTIATQPAFVYRHSWTAGEMVMWDNLATMHRAPPFESTTERRNLRRTTTIQLAH